MTIRGITGRRAKRRSAGKGTDLAARAAQYDAARRDAERKLGAIR